MTRWALAWGLFWLGHGVSRLMVDPFARLLFRPYQKLMQWSGDVQRGDDGPWRRPAESADHHEPPADIP